MMTTNEEHPKDSHISVQESTQQPLQALPDDNSTNTETSSSPQSTENNMQFEFELPSQLEMEGIPRRSGRLRSQPRWMEDYVPS